MQSTPLSRRQEAIRAGSRGWEQTAGGRAATPKRRAARSPASRRADLAVAQSPQPTSSRRQHAMSSHQRTRASDVDSDVALHLTGDERREREREAIMRQLQQAMHSNRKVFGQTIEDPRHVFAAFDRDGSGMLSPDELYGALKRLGLGLTDAQVGQLSAFLDTDGDGGIDYGELL